MRRLRLRCADPRAKAMAIAVLVAAACLARVDAACAQGGRERARPSSVLAQDFARSASKVRDGRIMLVSTLPPDRAKTELSRISALCRTIDGVFAGMRPDHQAELLEVWVVEDRNTYLGVIQSIGGVDGSNSGGMFVWDGDETRVFANGWRWSTIQHECWHACAHVFLSGMPTWLDEGLAEVFARGTEAGSDFAIGAISAEDIRKTNELIRTGAFEPFGIFIQRGAQWDDRLKGGDPAGRSQYVEAWAIAHFLLFADGGRHRPRLNTMLRELDRGRSGQAAVSAAIGGNRASIQALERGIVDYFARVSPFDPAARHAALLRWASGQGAPKDREGAIVGLAASGAFGIDAEALRSRLGRQVAFEDGRGDRTAVVRIEDEGGTVWHVSWPAVQKGATEAPPPTVRWSLR